MRWKNNVRALFPAPYLLALILGATVVSYWLSGMLAGDERGVRLWLGIAGAILMAGWPVVAFSRRLSRRLTRLADFSYAVAQGRVPAPLQPEGEDTMGRLEANLAAMAGSLNAQLRTAREEKGKLEAVLTGMVEGVLVIDRNGIIRLSNRRAEALFPAISEAMVGQPLINFSRDPELQDLVRTVMVGEGERPLVRDLTLERKGREILQVTATPIAEEEGEPQLFILVFHDITELKRLEAARRDFVGNVSHELRTPLTAIRGYAETLRAREVTDPALAQKFIAIIERHSERLGRLIDDLLTLSDLELGRAELQRAPMPLAPSVDAAIELVREKAVQGKVEVVNELPPNLPLLFADPDRVEQVLVNLIDNAVKYTPPGGRVTIAAQVVDRPELEADEPPDGRRGSWVEAYVADTGAGIPQNDLPRLTERFYRVDKARSRELGGTGLGLAIVKHIMQAHGGSLRIESEVGRGTRVYACFPADAGAEPAYA